MPSEGERGTKANEAPDVDAELFFHMSPKPDACDHDFRGWVELKDDKGRVTGGTTVCTKCGMDAMSYSLRMSD